MRIHTIILFLLIAANCSAQEKVKTKIKEKQPEPVAGKNNILKINLPALAFKNISVQYERKVGKKTSAALNIHTIPFGKLPFQGACKNVGGSSDVQYSQFQLGSFGIVPEFRLYLGKKGALRG